MRDVITVDGRLFDVVWRGAARPPSPVAAPDRYGQRWILPAVRRFFATHPGTWPRPQIAAAVTHARPARAAPATLDGVNSAIQRAVKQGYARRVRARIKGSNTLTTYTAVKITAEDRS